MAVVRVDVIAPPLRSLGRSKCRLQGKAQALGLNLLGAALSQGLIL